MANRLEELMALRSPNTSGADTKAVLQALAANPNIIATPTTYAYGMNVEDAQREGQIGAQNQQRREASIQDARNAAIQQEQNQFDMAMKAHQLYLAERNQAVSEKVAAAELAYKNAMMQGIPAEIEARKLANEKLMLEIEREKQMDSLMVTIPDPANPGKTKQMPARAFMGAGGKNILSAITGNPANETGAERLIRTRTEIYVRRGIPPEDAFLLASANPNLTFHQISKAIAQDIRNSKDQLGRPNFGSKKLPDGTLVKRSLDDYRAELYSLYIDQYLPMLSSETREKLKMWGPGALGLLDSSIEPNSSQSGLSQESMDALIQGFTEAYQ